MATTYFYTMMYPVTDETITTEVNLDDVIEWNVKDASLAFVIAILICISNLTIMLAFLTEKRLRVYSNYYVINMAIADLVVGLTAVGPACIQILYGYRWPFGYVSCAILIAISHAALHVSILMVLVISVDRWYAVYYPLKHISMRSRKSAMRRNVLVWAISLLLWVPVGGVWGIADPSNRFSNRCSPLYTRYFQTSLAAVIIFYWLPVSATAIFYFLIYRKVRTSKFQNLTNDRKKTFKTSPKNDSKVQQEVPVFEIACSTRLMNERTPTAVTPKAKMNRTYYKTNAKPRKRSQSLPVLDFSLYVSARCPSSSTSSPSGTLATTLEDSGSHQVILIDRNTPPSGSSQGSFEIGKPDHEVVSFINPGKSAKNEGITKREVELIDKVTEVKGRRTVHDVSKMQRTLSLLLIALVITWTPYASLVFAVTYCHIILQAARCFPAFLSAVALLISWCNSLLNPFMYAAAQPLFRKAVSRLFLRKTERIP